MSRRVWLLTGILLGAIGWLPELHAQELSKPDLETPASPLNVEGLPAVGDLDSDKSQDQPPAASRSRSATRNPARKDPPQAGGEEWHTRFDEGSSRQEGTKSASDQNAGAKKTPALHRDTKLRLAADAQQAEPASRPAQEPGENGRPATDRLPLGKQSVAVSVDVQAPASMNLNREATLRLVVRNTGQSDALNVMVNDELPDNLSYLSSQPEAVVVGKSLLSWRMSNLPAGSERVITVKVRPTSPGPAEHGATVTFLTGSKARTRILEPKLKVDLVANPTVGKVLKGQSVSFQVIVTNTGDGPARDITIQAKLSPGLRHDAGDRSDERTVFEMTLPELAEGQRETLDPLVADAIMGGEQTCIVTARSDDVVFNKDEAENAKTILVVEPKLKLALRGPDSRYTDTTADYELVVENPGTAPARKVRILATLPVNGRLVKPLPEGHYDSTTRRLQWTIDLLEPGSKPVVYPFHVRMGGVGDYEITAQAVAEGALKAMDRRHTEVVGMPDVDLVVSEQKRVVDVGGKTTFQIRLRNYGSKEASHVQITAKLSDNLQVEAAGGGSSDIKQHLSPDGHELKFSEIEKLGAGKELVLGVLVKVLADNPRLGTCRVMVAHDDLPQPIDDMAAIKIPSSRRASAAGP